MTNIKKREFDNDRVGYEKQSRMVAASLRDVADAIEEGGYIGVIYLTVKEDGLCEGEALLDGENGFTYETAEDVMAYVGDILSEAVGEDD